MKRIYSLQLAFAFIAVGVIGGSYLISSKSKSPHSDHFVNLDKSAVAVPYAIVVDLTGENTYTLPLWNDYAIMPAPFLLDLPQPFTDTYLYRSQAWIKANNLHKTGLITSFDSSNRFYPKIC